MDQHPIPRNVTGFEFQLIGFMSLKQFFYVLFGFGFALIFWKAPLGILSYPLAALAFFIGIAFAFIPVQDRPLEIWIKNFIVSIYSPTQFVWKQERRMPFYFPASNTTATAKPKKEKEVEVLQQDARAKLQSYLQTVQEKNSTVIDRNETELLSKVTEYINNSKVLKKPFTATQQPSTASSPSENRLTGIVGGTIRSGNTPLSGILLTIYDWNNEPVRMITSDRRGQFRIKLALPSGSYRLKTEDPNKKLLFKTYVFQIDQSPLKPWLITPMNKIS
jgi:hypothetical protein